MGTTLQYASPIINHCANSFRTYDHKYAIIAYNMGISFRDYRNSDWAELAVLW